MKKKILFYTDCPIFGGCEKPLFEVITSDNFASEYDFKVIFRNTKEYLEGLLLFCPSFPKSRLLGIKLLDINSVNLYLIKKIANPLFRKIAGNFATLLSIIMKPFIFIYDFLLLSILFGRNTADAIHINNGGYPGALGCRAAAVAARCAGFKKIIFSVHNTAIRSSGFVEKLMDHLVRRNVDVFVTGSKASGLALAKNRGFDKDKITTIYHGVRASNIAVRKTFVEGGAGHEQYILMVARCEERKGHEYALRAFKKNIVENPEFADLKLVLIGDGPIFNNIKKLIISEQLDNNVRLMGHRNDYLDYIASSLFLINPSIGYEDLPYVILEAMSLGVPVIGTDIAGMPEEIENGVTGIIVPPRDINALNQAMLTILCDNNVRFNMGIAAKKRFYKLFTLDKMTDDYMSFYNKLTS